MFAYLYLGQAHYSLKGFSDSEQAYLKGLEFADPTDKTTFQFIKGLRELYFTKEAEGEAQDGKLEDLEMKKLRNFERAVHFFHAKGNWPKWVEESVKLADHYLEIQEGPKAEEIYSSLLLRD